jgi:methylated-DNA-[protein]-cysteine S-methyltransferase
MGRPSPTGIHLFETPIGACAIAWGPRGVTGVHLPESSPRATLERLRARVGDDVEERTPPPSIRGAVVAISRMLAGEAVDLAAVPLDLDGVPPFHARVYQALRRLPHARTVSYGELAALAGSPPGAARAVGQAMARNRHPLLVPCHRVLGAGGAPTGFSAYGGLATKARLLALEAPSAAAPAQVPLFRGDRALPFDGGEAVRALSAADRALGRLIDRVGPLGLRLRALDDIFEALSHSIVYQQLSGKAAATILGRVCALFPDGRLAPRHYLGLDETALRGAGLSGGKQRAMRDLAEKALAGVVPPVADLHALDEDAIIERLTQVRGIGRWTVEMLLIFRLGRPDVLPTTDLGVRKGFQRAFRTRELPAPADVLERGERWRPYRSVASWYLWRANEL